MKEQKANESIEKSSSRTITERCAKQNKIVIGSKKAVPNTENYINTVFAVE